MDPTQPPAQATTPTPTQENAGIQARIDELTAKFRQAEEQNGKYQQMAMEAAAREAETSRKLAEYAARANAPAPVDPLAAFRDKVDPTVIEALQVQQAQQMAAFEQRMAQMQRQYAAQASLLQVRQEIQSMPGLPPQVAQRAEQLMAQWRAQGWDTPTSADAIDIALGQYQRQQLQRAAPVLTYQPGVAAPPVTPGFSPPPAATRKRLPDNFDSLAPDQQNLILEQNGILDESF